VQQTETLASERSRAAAFESKNDANGTRGGARVIPIVPMTESEGEVARQMQICNACRYCEGFCAVFPAMTRRLEFGKADVNYLANLCHNCGACYHACQYAPPHEFAVNVPQAMAKVRLETYTEYAWPAALGGLYKRNGVTLSVALAAGLALSAARHGAAWRFEWQRRAGELLRDLPAQPARSDIRRGLSVRHRRARHRRDAFLARRVRGNRERKRTGGDGSGKKRIDAQVPRRRTWRRL
jgi:ferredoxin